ncbi:para-nitrobenzyl esterase [Saccharopolyspora antimicrobica]|uniref:Para-nitrobenzyl esterase n=1 Tax=Saccharopolyspora antimicrobica TaxID=455193 RepID=A0A1I5EZS8_9PSEU|nr:carboxylesterase family protein [Saccharopolyspora antimicrobica]SFO17024.1 para-nitrobenzyl esterase [Saccharopolyspora antimicrobica]
MIDYWTDFARTGDPGWPRLRAGNAQQLAPDRIGPVDFAAEHHCDFWTR